MFGGIVQFWELIVNHNLHPFLVFFLLVWGVFTFRIIMASRNKPLKEVPGAGPQATVSALIMSYKDDPDILTKSLESVKSQSVPFDEIFVVMDAKESEKNIGLARQSGLNVLFDTGGNKRSAYAMAFRQSKGEIVAMLSGDTIYPRDMNREALKCFHHQNVGGVGFGQRIIDRNKNLIRRFADIMFSLRYKITYPCLSSRGALLCTTGETAFFRRAPIEKHLDEFLNERSWGKRCIIGDDRFLTSMVLKEGFKVVYQPMSEPILTDCPNTLTAFARQQVRWYRSNQKYSIKTLFQNWIPDQSPVLKIHLAGFLLMPYLWLAVFAWWLVNSATGLYPVEVVTWSFWLTLPIWALGFFIAMAIKASPHLLKEKRDLAIFPLYAIFVTLVILPLFVYAGVTVRDQGAWGTKRSSPSSRISGGSHLLIFLALAVVGVVFAPAALVFADAGGGSPSY